MVENALEKRGPERQGIIFLLFKDGKFLLEERRTPEKSYFGYTIVPGGRVEKKDLSYEEAAKREVEEECGVKVMKIVPLDRFLMVTTSNTLYKMSAFMVVDFEGDVLNKEGKSKHIWLSYEQAREVLCFADIRYVLLLAKEYLAKEGLLKD